MGNVDIRISKNRYYFLHHGIQYYIAGRIAYIRFLSVPPNISPILFHNAIEYFFKAVLSDHCSLVDLKDKRHDLPALLKLYIKQFPGSEVIGNKEFISKFHKFYKTRYIQPDGSHLLSQSFTLTKDKRNILKNNAKIPIKPYLEWSLEEVDEVIYNICKNIEIGPTSIYDYINFVAKDSPEFYKSNKFFNTLES